MCTRTGLRQTHAKDPPHLKPALRPLVLSSLPAIPFFFNLFAPNIMFLFSCLIKYGFLCCVVDFSPSDLVQLSPLTSALNVTEGILSFLRSLWPCGFGLVLCGSSILERDNGWGKIKMFREWLVMKWVYHMDDNFVRLPKNCTVVSKKVFLKQA